MSSGAFLRSRYQTDAGDIASIRIQPETAALTLNGGANSPPSGGVDLPGSARVGGGRRAFGINARLVRIAFSGAPPTGYLADSVITLPWLNSGTFSALIPGQTGSYLGSAVVLVGKTAESIR